MPRWPWYMPAAAVGCRFVSTAVVPAHKLSNSIIQIQDGPSLCLVCTVMQCLVLLWPVLQRDPCL